MLDDIDLAILSMLKDNARLQWKQIGDRIPMSGPAVANRIRRLEELGVIETYTIKLNERLLGNQQCVFVTVQMKDYGHTRFKAFIQSREEIKEAHRVSGEPCFILKVQVSDQDELARLLDDILEFGYYKINISIGQIK